jgi:hypothetical protein
MTVGIQNVELGIIKFPLLSALASRYPLSNQANASANRSAPKSIDSESAKPSMLYGENILPTSWGYTSIRADTVVMQRDLTAAAIAGEYPDIITDDKLAAPEGKYLWRLLDITGIDLKQYMVLMEIEHTFGYVPSLSLTPSGSSTPQRIYEAQYALSAKVNFRYYSQKALPGNFDYWSSPISIDLGVVSLLGNDSAPKYLYNKPYITVDAPKKESLILVSYESYGCPTKFIAAKLFSFTGASGTPSFTQDDKPFVDDYPPINSYFNPDECARTIAVSQGQLITADAYNVYWSSLSNYLDFKPSVTTGAGSGTPTGIQGRIVSVASIMNGIVVYSTANIINGRATGNSLYPYQFTESNISSGISHPDDISLGQQHNVNTSEGVASITLVGGSGINAELTEFITSKIFEYWDWSKSKIVTERLISSVDIRMKSIQDRYLVVSYKRKSDRYYTYAIVYDITLKKFGKIAYPHLDIATFNFDTEGSLKPITDFKDVYNTGGSYHNYSSFPPYQYASARNGSETPNARNNRIIALLGAAGELCVISPSYNTISFNSLIVLGKFQASKSTTATMQELVLDGVTSSTKVMIAGSYSGNAASDILQEFVVNAPIPNIAMGTIPVSTVAIPETDIGDTATYYGRITAKTFIAAISGSFHLTYGEAKIELAGRR